MRGVVLLTIRTAKFNLIGAVDSMLQYMRPSTQLPGERYIDVDHGRVRALSGTSTFLLKHQT